MIVLLFSSQPANSASAAYVNLAEAISNMWAPLNAASERDARFWTTEELYQWIDDAIDRLSQSCEVFIVYDQSLTTVANVSRYTQPDRWVLTIQADLGGETLSPRNVGEIEAKDDDWPGRPGDPEAFVLDTNGFKELALYPRPATGGVPIGQIMSQRPPAVSVSAPVLIVPQCLQEFFTFSALGEARAKETPAQMPEVAAWFRQLASMLMQVIDSYWGNG